MEQYVLHGLGNCHQSLIFNNESYAAGRTIEFRLVAICTGDVQSVPSNVVSYTYPGATITPTPTRTLSGPSPTRTRTQTRTRTPTVVMGTICQPPRNMTFNRYDVSQRAIYFDFDAPISGGLTRLHYQPQYRRLPRTFWSTPSFTVSATATSWGIIFGESFTPGRTIEFRLLAICTGDVESAPSNVVSYTYPGATPTPTSPFTRTNTPAMTTAPCQASNLRWTDTDLPIISMAWTNPPGVTAIELRYRIGNSGTTYTLSASDTTATLTRTDSDRGFFTTFTIATTCGSLQGTAVSPTVILTAPTRTSTPTITGTPTRTPTITISPPSLFCPAPSNLRFVELTDSSAVVTWNPVTYNIQCQPTNLRYTSTDPTDIQVEWDNPPHITAGRYSYGYGGTGWFDPFVTDADADPARNRIEVYQLEVQTRCSDGTEGTAITSLLRFNYGPRGEVSVEEEASGWPYGPPLDLRVSGSADKYLKLRWAAPAEGGAPKYRWEIRLNGSVASTSETTALSADVVNPSQPGDELTITVYSLYEHPEFGRLEYLVREISSREGGSEPRAPTGYYLSWSINGEEFFDPSFPYTIYIHEVVIGGAWSAGDTVRVRLQTLCTERPTEIVSSFVYTGTVAIPSATPTPTNTPFGIPPPTPTDHPGYSICPRPSNPRFDYANVDGVFYSFNPATYDVPCQATNLRYTSTSMDDVRLTWTNPANVSSIRINGPGSGGIDDDEPFTAEFDSDMTRFGINNITFQLRLFTRCTDGTRGVEVSQPLIFGTGYEPFGRAVQPYTRHRIRGDSQR